MVLNLTLNETINKSVSGTISTNLSSGLVEIKPLVIAILAIAIYAFFIFKFYRYLAARDLLKMHWHKKYGWRETFTNSIFKLFFFLFEHVILVPILVFFWFIIMTALILLLSNNSPALIMLISMAIIGAIRVTAYYKEELSRDLAKMIPFAILGVFIVDMSFFSIQTTLKTAQHFFSMTNTFIWYLLFMICLELVLRIIHSIIELFRVDPNKV